MHPQPEQLALLEPENPKGFNKGRKAEIKNKTETKKKNRIAEQRLRILEQELVYARDAQ